MDIVAITGTSQKTNENFIKNVSIEAYDIYSTGSQLARGGTRIYVNKNFNSFERNDLKINNEEYESVWIEINNKGSKSIVCGCLYRHPSNNSKEFLSYLEKCLSQLTKKNKEVYICGDFNFDLLNLENNHICQEFYNLLCSYGFLPKIIQPSRITDYHASLIDNIFSNNLSDEILSGNILLTLSEHFSQFVSVRREKIDFKNVKIYQRDYSKFDNSLFSDDVSIQKWDATYENVNDQFNDFFWKLNGCVERHAPIKELSPKEIKMKSKPWITPGITKLIRNKNKLFKRKKRQPNNENIKELYNQKRNQVNREIKRSKKYIMSNILKITVTILKKSGLESEKL